MTGNCVENPDWTKPDRRWKPRQEQTEPETLGPERRALPGLDNTGVPLEWVTILQAIRKFWTQFFHNSGSRPLYCIWAQNRPGKHVAMQPMHVLEL